MKLLLLLIAVALVSSAGLFAHRALAEATPLALAAWRLGLAALFFSLWERVTGRTPLPRVPGVAIRLWLAGICLALHFLVWFASLQTATVARATLLVCTTPLWTMAGSALLKRRRFVLLDGAAVLLAAVGLWLVTGTGSVGHGLVRGDLLALLGGALFACYLLLMEGMHIHVPARRQVTATYTAAAMVLWVAMLIAQPGLPRLHYSPGVWKAILGMAIGPQILGHTLLNASLRHFTSSAVAFAILLEPPLTAWLAWLLFGQSVTPIQGIGGALTLLALACALRKSA